MNLTAATRPIALSLICLAYIANSWSDTKPAAKVLEIRFENRQFSPQTLTVPAQKALQIKVVNASNERIEFESFSLNRERIVEPGASVTMNLPALRPGSYDFFDDFHQDVPEGTIMAK